MSPASRPCIEPPCARFSPIRTTRTAAAIIKGTAMKPDLTLPPPAQERDELDDHGKRRRTALSCMAWAGAGVSCTVSVGVPVSRLISSAQAAEQTQSFSFVQISDSHIGFNKDPNTEPTSTLEEAIDRVSAMGKRPAFMIHTGDITHLSKPAQFDTAMQIIGKA